MDPSSNSDRANGVVDANVNVLNDDQADENSNRLNRNLLIQSDRSGASELTEDMRLQSTAAVQDRAMVSSRHQASATIDNVIARTPCK